MKFRGPLSRGRLHFDRRAAALLAAAGLAFSAGCRRDPRAPLKLAAGVSNHGFALDLPHDRVLYIRGEYPQKSFFCTEPIAGNGRRRSFRLPGFSLTGDLFPLRDGGALLTARTVVSEDADEESSRAVLKVDVEHEKMIADYALRDSALRTFAQTSWLPAPVAVVQNEGGLSVVPLQAGADLNRGVPLAGTASLVAVDQSLTVIAAAASDRTGRGALRLFDAATGRVEHEVGVSAPEYLASRADGHWLASVEDEGDHRSMVVDFDPKLGRPVPLFSSSGAVESIVAGKRWLFAVALSTEPHPQADPHWLRPSELHRVDLTGAEPALTLPWTKRKGALLGLDESAARLYFAVTDKDDPAVWSLDFSSDSLRGAASAIDGSWRVSWGLISAIALTAMLAALAISVLWALVDGPR
jgi:hypothetical protein